MNENQIQKKEWIKPEMVDLDVEKTADSYSPSDIEVLSGQGQGQS